MHSLRKAAATLAMAGIALTEMALPASATPVEILFVGNSFTFGKYAPVRNYMSGYDSGPGASAVPHVHDLQCLSAASCSAAESVALSVPSTNPAVTGIPNRESRKNEKQAAEIGRLLARPA